MQIHILRGELQGKSAASAKVDARWAFLARASALQYLFEHGEISADEAFARLLPAMRDLVQGRAA